MVRLVFRPYAQVKRSICTSEPLQTSTRVSSGFLLLKHSSPSFGSPHARSSSAPPNKRIGQGGDAPGPKPGFSPRPAYTDLHFRFARGAKRTPFDSRACWTPWSVFQDGSDEHPARTRWTQGAEVKHSPPTRSMPRRPQHAVNITTPSKQRRYSAPRRGPAR